MGQFGEYVRMALINIRTNKGRTFLTMLGIIIGISSVIMIMTIRKRLALSNILMVVVPPIIGAVMVIVIFNMYAARYLDSLEEMYEDKNGIYSAQSIVYAYRDELSKEDWSEETLAEQQNTAASPEPTKKMSALESELTDLGYHFRVTIDGMGTSEFIHALLEP